MKIVVAPNAFKGSMTAVEAAKAMAEGIADCIPDCEVIQVPVADGGDGLVDVLSEALGAEKYTRKVRGPLGDPVEAAFCYCSQEKTAIVEMALASGIALLDPYQRDPLRTGTYGTGELIAAGLELGAKKLIIGIGGSATNDGGIGMAAALGVRFLDSDGKDVDPVGGSLQEIYSIDASGLKKEAAGLDVEVVCDVDNPLLGERGAANVYGPQKGAGPEDIQFLDKGLANLAEIIKRDLGKEVTSLPGGGAAGGLGAGLNAFLGGKLRRGVDVILDLVKINDSLTGADLAITAEGLLDHQTAFGKAPAGVAERAKAAGIPCIAIGGGLTEDAKALHDYGFSAIFSICPRPVSLEEAMSGAHAFLRSATEEVVRAFMAGRK